MILRLWERSIRRRCIDIELAELRVAREEQAENDRLAEANRVALLALIDRVGTPQPDEWSGKVAAIASDRMVIDVESFLQEQE